MYWDLNILNVFFIIYIKRLNQKSICVILYSNIFLYNLFPLTYYAYKGWLKYVNRQTSIQGEALEWKENT